MNPTLPIAFLAGLATFFSPCVLPIIPGYLSVLSGGQRDKVIRRVIFFSIGLALVFTTLGVIIGWVGSAVVPLRDFLIKLIGAVLVIYGIHLIKPLPLGFLRRDFKIDFKSSESTDLSAFSLGAVFGIAWTPCSGVILGAILAQALFFQALTAAPLLFSFSLGLIVPMLAIALIYQRSGRFIKLPNWLGRFYSPAVGIIVLILGLSLLTGWIDYWRSNLLSIFPNLESGLLPAPR